MDPDEQINAVLRAIDQAGARLTLVVRKVAGGEPQVLGVIRRRLVVYFQRHLGLFAQF